MRAETKTVLHLTKEEQKVLTDFYKNLVHNNSAYSIYCILEQIAEKNFERTSCKIEITD